MTDRQIVYEALRDHVPTDQYYGPNGAASALERLLEQCESLSTLYEQKIDRIESLSEQLERAEQLRHDAVSAYRALEVSYDKCVEQLEVYKGVLQHIAQIGSALPEHERSAESDIARRALAPHKRLWLSPHGTSWVAESYEEALEMERDSLHEEYNRLLEQLEASRVDQEVLREGFVQRGTRISELEEQFDALNETTRNFIFKVDLYCGPLHVEVEEAYDDLDAVLRAQESSNSARSPDA